MPSTSWPSGTASRSTSDDPRHHEDHDGAEHDEDIVFRRRAGIVFVAPGFSTRYETCPGASDLVSTTTPPTALAPRSRRANIRANKPVPERRTQLHAVADVPSDGRPDRPERDDAGQSDTTCDGIELPTDQKVGHSRRPAAAQDHTARTAQSGTDRASLVAFKPTNAS